MRKRTRCSALILALLACATASNALAQTAGAVPAQAPAPTKAPWLNTWDASGVVGWVVTYGGGGGEDLEAYWIGGTVGRFLTEHVKVELDIAAAGTLDYSAHESLSTGYRHGYVRQTQTKLGIGLVYQFRSNAKVHPFIGAGVDADFNRLTTQLYTYTAGPCVGYYCGTTTEEPQQNTRSVEAAPFVTGGFKFFVSRSAYVRLDARFGVAGDRNMVATRCGLGFDF